MGTISYFNIHIEIRCVKGRVHRILWILFSTFLNKAVEHTQLCVPNSNLEKKLILVFLLTLLMYLTTLNISEFED